MGLFRAGHLRQFLLKARHQGKGNLLPTGTGIKTAEKKIRISLRMNNFRALIFFCGVVIALLSGCDANTIVDSNMSMPARNWNYANKVKTVIEIKDAGKPVS